MRAPDTDDLNAAANKVFQLAADIENSGGIEDLPLIEEANGRLDRAIEELEGWKTYYARVMQK
ncbi:MAG: hypothetical protein S0880_07380 [Actinomycetota bacterium]|nr:hypothetical protein [Actinomycetota bacterium]